MDKAELSSSASRRAVRRVWNAIRTSSILIKVIGVLLLTAALLATIAYIAPVLPVREGIGMFAVGLWALIMALVTYYNWPLSMGFLVVHIVLLLHLNNNPLFTDAAANYSSTAVILALSFVLYAELLVIMIYYAYNISQQKQPRPVSEHALATILFRIDLALYRMRVLLIPLLYVVIVVITILVFAQIYNNLIAHSSNQLVYFSSGEKVSEWDALYFSSVTFFTIGYGDVVPKGNLLKLFVQLEMIVGHLINVFYAATLLNFLISNLATGQTQNHRDP